MPENSDEKKEIKVVKEKVPFKECPASFVVKKDCVNIVLNMPNFLLDKLNELRKVESLRTISSIVDKVHSIMKNVFHELNFFFSTFEEGSSELNTCNRIQDYLNEVLSILGIEEDKGVIARVKS